MREQPDHPAVEWVFPRAKSALSPAGRRLIELMQRINYGVITDLLIRDGQPSFDRPPRVSREIKLGAASGPTPQADLQQFELKLPVTLLFQVLNDLGTGIVDRVDVRGGLPFKITISEAPAERGD